MGKRDSFSLGISSSKAKAMASNPMGQVGLWSVVGLIWPCD